MFGSEAEAEGAVSVVGGDGKGDAVGKSCIAEGWQTDECLLGVGLSISFGTLVEQTDVSGLQAVFLCDSVIAEANCVVAHSCGEDAAGDVQIARCVPGADELDGIDRQFVVVLWCGREGCRHSLELIDFNAVVGLLRIDAEATEECIGLGCFDALGGGVSGAVVSDNVGDESIVVGMDFHQFGDDGGIGGTAFVIGTGYN